MNIGFVKSNNGNQNNLDNQELIAELRLELIDTKISLTDSKSEILKLKDENYELNKKLQNKEEVTFTEEVYNKD